MHSKVFAFVFCLSLPVLVVLLAPEEKRHSVISGLPIRALFTPIQFKLDDQSTIEYWHWKRMDVLPAKPVTWVMPGIGGPGSFLDSEFATDLIESAQSRHVDQIIIVQLRGHSLESELACSLDLDFDPCIEDHLSNGIDLTKYHYLQYAQDVIELRKHLNINQWHIWGASYGARVAGAMAMLDPDGTSSLLLDSPIAFKPSDRPSDYRTSSELLHKLYAACQAFQNCFDDESRSLEQLALFIEQFETPSIKVFGVDYISIFKEDWIYTLNGLMYSDSFDLAIDYIFTHIENPKGFSVDDLSEEIKLFFEQEYDEWLDEDTGKWSINYQVTTCNENPSKNTFKVTKHGVYGQELDMANHCWSLKDWSAFEFIVPDIPVMIVHLPFDNVITYQDGESYLEYWPYAQWCTIESIGHTMPFDYTSEMIDNLSRNDAYAPSYCQPREPKVFQSAT